MRLEFGMTGRAERGGEELAERHRLRFSYPRDFNCLTDSVFSLSEQVQSTPAEYLISVCSAPSRHRLSASDAIMPTM